MRAFAWKKTPALAAAISCAAGIWLSDSAGAVSPRWLFIVAAFTLGAGIVRCARRKRSAGSAHAVCAVLLIVATGFTRYQHSVFSGEVAWAALLSEHGTRRIHGRVVSVGGRDDWLRIELAAIAVDEELRLPGRLMLFVRQDSDARLTEPIEYGTTLTVRADLDQVPRVRNPSDFNYGRWLRRHGVRAVATVNAPDITISHQQRRLRDVFTSAARNHVRAALEAHVSTRARPVLEALLLGDRSEIETSVRDSFVNTGLVHVLAVSGLHVMIVGFACHALLGPFLRRFRLPWRVAEGLRTVATMILLCFYVALAGLPASAVRAATMTAFLLAGPLFRRSAHSLNSLFGAACLIMIVWPGSLFDAGLQLSVSAVTGILVLVPRWSASSAGRASRRYLGAFVTGNVLVTTAATIATAPVLLAHFGRMSAAGLVLNIPAIPLTATSLTSAVLAVATAPAPSVASRFGAAADASTQSLLHVASVGSEWFRNASIVGAPDAATLVCLALAVVGLLLARRRGAHWRYLVAVLLVLASAEIVDTYRRHILARCEVLFLDVGQGDAALLTGPAGRTMLIDTGGPPFRNALRQPVIAHLTRRDLAVDLLVLTHAHADHAGAAPDILRRVKVRRIITSGLSLSSPLMDEIHHLADSLGIPVLAVRMGDALSLEPGVAVQVLGPSPFLPVNASENDRSVALRVRCGETRMLFLGDAEAEAEAAMAARYGDHLKTDIVKVGHHGSRTSSTAYFLNRTIDGAVGKVAVISVATRNRYGLPDEEVVERWRNAGYKTILTADNGAVRIRAGHDGVFVNPWR